jgi:hypothetical protein
MNGASPLKKVERNISSPSNDKRPKSKGKRDNGADQGCGKLDKDNDISLIPAPFNSYLTVKFILLYDLV